MAVAALDKSLVIAKALGEVGYLEKATNANLDDPTANAGNGNYNKYARDLDAIPFFNGAKNGYDWCAVFVCWAFNESYGYEAAKTLLCLPPKASSNYAAGVDYFANYFRKNNQFHTEPQPGDVIFFGKDDASATYGVDLTHTGLVVEVTNKAVYTVEGNTNPNAGVVSDGQGVYKKTYALNHSRIKGYGRPDYSASTFISENRYLSEAEMMTNAAYIYNYLHPRGWTMESIAAMLGNMETESSINPGIWQNLTENPSNGYGLVQWTPATKYTDWCDENGLEPSHMASALQRIEYELENHLQWFPSDYSDMTFAEFKASTASVYDLALVFLANYERPADPTQPQRGTQAESWYEFLRSLPKTGPIAKKSRSLPLLLMYMATRRNV